LLINLKKFKTTGSPQLICHYFICQFPWFSKTTQNK